jgi:hypothetical protein|eukprot:SAG25_NODE_579_length_6770_cov_59.668266_7_plen_92_part_00
MHLVGCDQELEAQLASLRKDCRRAEKELAVIQTQLEALLGVKPTAVFLRTRALALSAGVDMQILDGKARCTCEQLCQLRAVAWDFGYLSWM